MNLLKIELYRNKHNYHYLYVGENIHYGFSMLDQLQRDNRADNLTITYDCPAGNGPRFINLDALNIS